MSRDQWAAIQHGDESYAGCPRWFAFLRRSRTLFPFRHVIPTHQGRAAEKILFTAIGGPGQGRSRTTPTSTRPGPTSSSRARRPWTWSIAEGRQPVARSTRSRATWTSRRSSALLAERGPTTVPVVMRDDHQQLRRRPAGQPREPPRRPRGLRPASACRSSSTPAGSPRTPGSSRPASRARRDRPIADIVREMASLADGMTMSAKKDGLANIGGWLALNDDAPRRAVPQPADPDRGLPDLRRPGRARPRGDRPGPARGRRRGLPALPDPLHGVPRRGARSRPACPCVQPFGGHAVYLDARALLPHIPPLAVPGPGAGRGAVPRGRDPRLRDRHGHVRAPPGRDRDAGGDGPRAPGDPAPDVHAEPHRLRHRGGPLGRRARSQSCAATGSSTSRPPCGTSRPASQPLG